MNPYASGVPVPGSVVGPWKLVRELGRGTTSIVFAAVAEAEAGDLTEVALKLALPGTLRDQQAVDRFLRGATLQRTLGETTEGALPVVDLGTDPLAGPYVVTPLISGPTLGEALAAGQLPATAALQALTDVASVLDAAAAAGLVHRDVKPSNILLGPERAWLADFGLARDHEDDPTVTGALAGTLAYLAPEVIRGGAPTAASDRYALACVAFQVLTGSPVFPRPTDAAVLYAHVDEPPPAATGRRAALPATVDPVLAAGLAKAPAARTGSAVELVDALIEAVGDAAPGLGSPDFSPVPTGTETVEPADPRARQASEAGGVPPAVGAGRSARARSRNRFALVGGTAALAAAVAVGGAVLAGGGGSETANQAAPPVAPGLQEVGSALEPADDIAALDCEGRAPSGASPACSLLQLSLPERRVVVPAQGIIRGWAVRGARGDLTLQVLRRRDGEIYQVARAETVHVTSAAPQRFETELDVDAGDLLALDVAPGSAVGQRPTPGATTERWSAPVGAGSGAGDRSGPGHELLFRGELEAGARRRQPRQLTGAEAAAAPAGRELAASSAPLPDGRQVRVALRLVGGALVLDLERGGKRRSRLFLPRVDPRGHVVELRAFESPGNQSQLNFAWRNPGAAKDVEQYFGLNAESLDAYT